jgi:hypothetical protein
MMDMETNPPIIPKIVSMNTFPINRNVVNNIENPFVEIS